MPRISRGRANLTSAATDHPVPSRLQSPSDDDGVRHNITLLRRHWKWAVFSQFFYTFSRLFNLPDVSLNEIEQDLARSTALVLPRVIVRLIHTISHDKKTNLDNWQSSLRRQYERRNPDVNPLGPETASYPAESSPNSRGPSAEPEDMSLDTHTAIVHSDGADPAIGPLAGSELLSAPGQDAGQIVDEKHVDWLQLPMNDKLDTLHLLTEWQFHNVNKLRQVMRDDGDDAKWRVEPIGYDAKLNAYWLMGDRLWIQRSTPRPASAKRKRPASGKQAPAKAARMETAPLPSNTPLSLTITQPTRRSRVIKDAEPVTVAGAPGKRSARAAKLQANIKLDEQAKALEAFRREYAGTPKRGRSERESAPRRTTRMAGTPSRAIPPSTGTRVSARLRGSTAKSEDEEWQAIPEHWLGRSAPANSAANDFSDQPSHQESPGDGGSDIPCDDDDQLSDLTDLSDEHRILASRSEPHNGGNAEDCDASSPGDQAISQNSFGATETPQGQGGDEPGFTVPRDFIEWETICVTLEEWEHIADPFKNASHYLEKALFKTLSRDIAPPIISDMREIHRQRKVEEAIVNRKRSSRIAIKESEKEVRLKAAQQKAEEEAELVRAKRIETRQLQEQAEQEKKKSARERRRVEREERERRQEQESTRSSTPVDIMTNGENNQQPVMLTAHSSTFTSRSGTRTPIGDWELSCEICFRHGMNQDDGVPIVACARCSRWQHIPCHDRADRVARRPKKDWDAEEFVCQRCRYERQQHKSLGASFDRIGPNNGHLRQQISRQGQPHSGQNVSTQPPAAYPNSFHISHPDAVITPLAPASGTNALIQQHLQTHQSIGPNLTFNHYQPHRQSFVQIEPDPSTQHSASINRQSAQSLNPHSMAAVYENRQGLPNTADSRPTYGDGLAPLGENGGWTTHQPNMHRYIPPHAAPVAIPGISPTRPLAVSSDSNSAR